MLRRTTLNEEGKSPIVVRVSYRDEIRDTFTGLYVEDRFWIKRVGKVEPNNPKASVINGKLSKLAHRVYEHFEELKYSRKDFSIDKLADKIRGKNSPPETLMEYVEEKIKEYKARITIDLAKPTWYKYERVKKYLIEFLKTTKKLKNIPISMVDAQLLNQFYIFLRTDKKNCNNSAVTLMNFLRTVLRKPIRCGQIKEDPFTELKLRFTPVDRGFLTRDDLAKLSDCKFDSEALDRNRDIFLLACYTGLAYVDIKELTSDHIIKDADGSYYIKKTRHKTNIISQIPLLPLAERILKKYSINGDVRSFDVFVPTNQKLNFSLKTIGTKAEIEKPLHMHLGRHTFATTVTLSNKVPIESVSKMLGHSTLKHTVRYARVVGEKIKSDMEYVKGIFK